ncbi:MAG: Nif11-like leader peptide family natural product precursor [Deltaproteobacteria bacterium]|nr:Nif11-like leader peptide family natural product precursor [Deltaproteobacteria bacterium]
MSIESAKACVEKLKSDPSLGRSLVAAKNDEARKQIMQQAGFNFTKQEFMQALGTASGNKGELREEELDTISGGMVPAATAVPAIVAATM